MFEKILFIAIGYLLIGVVFAFAVPFFVWVCRILEDYGPLKEVIKSWFDPEADDDAYAPVIVILTWPLVLVVGVPALIYGLLRLLCILIYRKYLND